MAPPSSKSPASQASIDWLRVREVAGQAFDRAKFFYFADAARHPEMMTALARLVANIREYAVASPQELKPLWEKLRESPTIVDLLMDVTAEIALLTGYAFADMAALYAKATHAAVPRSIVGDQMVAATNNITDGGFLDSVANEGDFRALLTDNPWLLTVLVLKQIGKFNPMQAVAPRSGSPLAPLAEPVAADPLQ
jgi:hypothetical protein